MAFCGDAFGKEARVVPVILVVAKERSIPFSLHRGGFMESTHLSSDERQRMIAERGGGA